MRCQLELVGALSKIYFQLAWQNGTKCVNYKYSQMGTVLQTTSANGSIVAFKVDSPNNMCPNGENPPTFNNTNATVLVLVVSELELFQGALYIDDDNKYFPMWVYYNIYMSGNTWKVSYRSNRSSDKTNCS